MTLIVTDDEIGPFEYYAVVLGSDKRLVLTLYWKPSGIGDRHALQLQQNYWLSTERFTFDY